MQSSINSTKEWSPRISVKVFYEPSPGEERPVTFQIGMVCPEGVVLASDRQMTRRTGFRAGHKSQKIESCEDENIAFCSAGDNFCLTFTEVVREWMSEGLADKSFLSVKRGLIDCVTAAWAKEEEFRQARKKETGREPAPCSGGNTLLVLREQDAIQLWMITTNKETAHPNPQQVYDCIPVGDNTAAVFFLNHYWAKIPKTIDCLVTLAVHTVLMAKSEFVDGLEVGVFTHSRFGLLSDDELHSAIEMSKELDSYTARKLGIPGL